MQDYTAAPGDRQTDRAGGLGQRGRQYDRAARVSAARRRGRWSSRLRTLGLGLFLYPR